jgi:hypothetical protein
MSRLAAFALALALMPALSPAIAGDEPIPPEEWRKMTLGRTVYYYIGGSFFGREYYWPGSDMVTFQHVSGACAEAPWDFAEGRYCFYFDRAHCFRHVRRGDEIVIIPVNPENEDATEQTVKKIAPVSFTCDPGTTS